MLSPENSLIFDQVLKCPLHTRPDICLMPKSRCRHRFIAAKRLDKSADLQMLERVHDHNMNPDDTTQNRMMMPPTE